MGLDRVVVHPEDHGTGLVELGLVHLQGGQLLVSPGRVVDDVKDQDQLLPQQILEGVDLAVAPSQRERRRRLPDHAKAALRASSATTEQTTLYSGRPPRKRTTSLFR